MALCREVGGLAESWVNGISWRELCRDTSLDQGDICRTLRRTVEILRQIPMASGIDPLLAQAAMRAAHRMDRFPVAEMDSQTGESKDTSGLGFGLGAMATIAGELIDSDSIVDSLLLEDEDDLRDQTDLENDITQILADNFFDGPRSGNDGIEKEGIDDGILWKARKSKVASILREFEGEDDQTSADDASTVGGQNLSDLDLDALLEMQDKEIKSRNAPTQWTSQSGNGRAPTALVSQSQSKKFNERYEKRKTLDAEALEFERKKFQ